MRRTTCNILFFIRRTKELKDGTVPIYVRITVNKQRVELRLQKSIEESLWHTQKGYALGTSKATREINSYLDFVKSKLLIKKRELEEVNRILTASSLKNHYLGIEDSGKTILQIFREHNERCEGLMNIDFSPGTVERYKSSYGYSGDIDPHSGILTPLKVLSQRTDVV